MPVRNRLAGGALAAALAATGGFSLMVATSGVAHAGTQCSQYRSLAQYWANQADEDFDAAMSYVGSSVMVGDQTAYDYFVKAYEYDIGQRQYYSGRYNTCNQVPR